MSRSRNRRRRPTFCAFSPHFRYLFFTVTSLTFNQSATSAGVRSRLLPPCMISPIRVAKQAFQLRHGSTAKRSRARTPSMLLAIPGFGNRGSSATHRTPQRDDVHVALASVRPNGHERRGRHPIRGEHQESVFSASAEVRHASDRDRHSVRRHVERTAATRGYRRALSDRWGSSGRQSAAPTRMTGTGTGHVGTASSAGSSYPALTWYLRGRCTLTWSRAAFQSLGPLSRLPSANVCGAPRANCAGMIRPTQPHAPRWAPGSVTGQNEKPNRSSRALLDQGPTIPRLLVAGLYYRYTHDLRGAVGHRPGYPSACTPRRPTSRGPPSYRPARP